MGTTLTGTTPQDTYDSLIKVTDNGPLSGSLKTLTDGLGNDSALALSTGAASITGTLAVSGATTLGVSTALNWGARGGITQDASYNFSWSTNGVADAFYLESASGNVGIGTSSPAAKLHVAGENIILDRTGGDPYISFYTGGTTNNVALYGGASTGFRAFVGGSERLRITDAGLVGIGTSSPNAKATIWTPSSAGQQTALRLNNPFGFDNANTGAKIVFSQDRSTAEDIPMGEIGVGQTSAFSSNDAYLKFSVANGGTVSEVARFLSGGGLTFNGDTAAANALDDYEEGTFTVALTPSTSGTITLNATYSTWSYTKIGNQVTVNGLAVVSSVSSPVGTYIKIGLPFTVGNSDSKYGGNSCLYSDASLSYAKSLLGGYNPKNTSQSFVYIDASTIATNDEFYFTTTYFV